MPWSRQWGNLILEFTVLLKKAHYALRRIAFLHRLSVSSRVVDGIFSTFLFSLEPSFGPLIETDLSPHKMPSHSSLATLATLFLQSAELGQRRSPPQMELSRAVAARVTM